MRTAITAFTKNRSSQYYWTKLSPEEQRTLNKFKDKLLVTAGEPQAESTVRQIVRFRHVMGRHLDEVTTEDLQYYLRDLKRSAFSDYFKNNVKACVKRFLKWHYKDWSERFEELEDIRFNSDARRKRPITSDDVLTPEQLDRILEAERDLFWKTFFITQYEGACRTGEVRKLRWSEVTFKDDGFTDVKVHSKKNRNAAAKVRELPLLQATKFLMALKKQQEAEGIETEWVFPRKDPSEYVSKAVNAWFRELTTRALGKPIHNYVLRHTRGTELARLVHEGKIAKSLALMFMGHSERMFDRVYSHVTEGFLNKQMKAQIYGVDDVPEEKKHQLEQTVEELRGELAEMRAMTAEILRAAQSGVALSLPKRPLEPVEDI